MHIATVLVAGDVGPDDPDRIAEEYWRLHSQPRNGWERDAVYA